MAKVATEKALTHYLLGDFNKILRKVIFKLILVTGDYEISSEIALRWTSLDLNDDKSTLVQVMAWCRQATRHYMNQCWPRSLPPYGVTRPQWVLNINLRLIIRGIMSHSQCGISKPRKYIVIKTMSFLVQIIYKWDWWYNPAYWLITIKFQIENTATPCHITERIINRCWVINSLPQAILTFTLLYAWQQNHVFVDHAFLISHMMYCIFIK